MADQTAKAAAAVDEALRGRAPRSRRGDGPVAGKTREPERKSEAEKPEAGERLALEQRIHMLEAELGVAKRQRDRLEERVSALEVAASTAAPDQQEEIRVLRAQVEDLTRRVASQPQSHGWGRFGLSFDLFTL